MQATTVETFVLGVVLEEAVKAIEFNSRKIVNNKKLNFFFYGDQ
jgi:hypothetical protein